MLKDIIGVLSRRSGRTGGFESIDNFPFMLRSSALQTFFGNLSDSCRRGRDLSQGETSRQTRGRCCAAGHGR